MEQNGNLLDCATARTLSSLGVGLFHVALDGPSDAHDQSRRRADGAGTFSRIWQNLEALRKRTIPLRVILWVHLSPHSSEELVPFMDEINALCSDDERFAVYFKPIKRLGGPNDATIEVLDKHSRERITDVLRRHLANPRMVYESPEPTVCYAAKANSLVVRANGDLAKCTVALNDDKNRIGRLHEMEALRSGKINSDIGLGDWQAWTKSNSLAPMGRWLLQYWRERMQTNSPHKPSIRQSLDQPTHVPRRRLPLSMGVSIGSLPHLAQIGRLPTKQETSPLNCQDL